MQKQKRVYTPDTSRQSNCLLVAAVPAALLLPTTSLCGSIFHQNALGNDLLHAKSHLLSAHSLVPGHAPHVACRVCQWKGRGGKDKQLAGYYWRRDLLLLVALLVVLALEAVAALTPLDVLLQLGHVSVGLLWETASVETHAHTHTSTSTSRRELKSCTGSPTRSPARQLEGLTSPHRSSPASNHSARKLV